MKHDKIIYARVPDELRNAIEKEHRIMSKATGTKIKTSAVIRAILEEKLYPTRTRSA